MGQKGQFTGTKHFGLLVPIFSGYKTDYGVCAELQFEFARFLSVREFVKCSKNILKIGNVGIFKNKPERDDLPSTINESLVVELYSK